MREINQPNQDKKVDGRVARSAAQQDAIKTALIELVAEGNFTPTAVDVAEKTGISVRTVFRHFSNIEELYASMASTIRELAFTDMPEAIQPGPWDNRLQQIIVRRRIVFEALLNSLEFMIINRHQSAYVREAYQDILQESQQFLEVALNGFVDQSSEKFEALTLLFSPAHWRTLRMEHRLSAEHAEDVLLTDALALFPEPEPV